MDVVTELQEPQPRSHGFSLLVGGAPSQACGLCVNKMANATLSSEDEEIENPIETAVNRGALLVEPEKASISRKRSIRGQYKASREHKNPNSLDYKAIVIKIRHAVLRIFEQLYKMFEQLFQF